MKKAKKKDFIMERLALCCWVKLSDDALGLSRNMQMKEEFLEDGKEIVLRLLL